MDINSLTITKKRFNKSLRKFFLPILLSGIFVLIFSSQNYAIPSFSRQTNLSCNYCHYTPPALNSFGRMYKLNGYTLTNVESIEAVTSDSSRTTLKLLNNLPVSAMFVANATSVSKKFVTGGDNNFVQVPSEMSIFIGGEITPHIGAFIQTTYALSDGTFGLDMLDIRYANHTKIASNDLLYGITLNNRPTSQDVWNTTEAWGFPFVGSEAAPSPSVSVWGISEGVAGIGAYALYDELIYAELSAYHASPAGVAYPPDNTWAPNIKGVAPYWRIALQHQWIGQYLSVGTYGMSSKVFQAGIADSTNEGINLGFDAQYEKNLENGSSFIFHAAYETAKITEKPQNIVNNLRSLRADLTYNFPEWISLSAGYFSITGDNLITLVPMGLSSFNGLPDSNGEIFQLTFIPWLNTQFALQYTIYNKFDGSSNNYDGNGRNAADNNTLNLSAWLVL
jgi:hypothetical protein